MKVFINLISFSASNTHAHLIIYISSFYETNANGVEGSWDHCLVNWKLLTVGCMFSKRKYGGTVENVA